MDVSAAGEENGEVGTVRIHIQDIWNTKHTTTLHSPCKVPYSPRITLN